MSGQNCIDNGDANSISQQPQRPSVVWLLILTANTNFGEILKEF